MLLQCSLTLTCSQNLGPNTGAKMRHKGLSMDTIVHLVQCGVKYKCLSVCSKWDNYFSRVYHSDVWWKWVKMGTPAPKLTLSWEHIKEHLRTSEAIEATPTKSHQFPSQVEPAHPHLSHLGKNQCCTSWYETWVCIMWVWLWVLKNKPVGNDLSHCQPYTSSQLGWDLR
jgi:hypothetical protein